MNLFKNKHLLFIFILLVIILYEIKIPIMSYEAVRTGLLMLEHKTLNVYPLYQFTLSPGQNIINPQWMFQIFLAVLYQINGINFISIVFTLMIALNFFLIYRFIYFQTKNSTFSGLLAFCIFLLSIQFISARSYVLAMFFGLLTLTLLQLNKKLFLIPFIHVLWVNTHLSFPLCYVFLLAKGGEALYRSWKKKTGPAQIMKEKEVKSVFLIFFITLFSSLINPYGINLFREIIGAFNSKNALSYITEWAPTTIHETSGLFFILVSLGLIFIIFKKNRAQGSPGLFKIILFVLFYFYGLTAIRNILWWDIIILPLYAKEIYSFLMQTRIKKYLTRVYFTRCFFNALLLGTLFFLIVFKSPYLNGGLSRGSKNNYYGVVNDPFSMKMINYLKNDKKPGVQNHLFLYNDETTFYMFHLAPDYSFLTGAMVGYFKNEIRDYQLISMGIYSYRDLLNKYKIKYLILHKDHQVFLIQALLKNKNYRLIMSNGIEYLFMKETGKM